MTKILLVEDDKSLREIYGVRLTAEGYQIISAGDGELALAMAVKERPDLIISDVMMPKISGFDMLDIIRSTPETKDLKVIMMTALSSEDQRSRGETLGANRYLVKSQVGIEDVVRAVHDILGDSPIASAAPNTSLFGVPPLTAAAVRPAQPSTPAPTPINAPIPQLETVQPTMTTNNLTPQNVVQVPVTNPLATPAPAQSITPPAQVISQPVPTPVQPTPSFAPAPTESAPAQFSVPAQPTPQPAQSVPQPTVFNQPQQPQVQQAPEPYISPEQKAILGDRVISPINQMDSPMDIASLINQELNGTQPTTNNQAPINPNQNSQI